ncbi:hypothetical protein JCM9279_004819 [Rhodotorula babjevae]
MEEQHQDSALTATPPPIVLGPHDEPIGSTSPSPAPSSASSQAAAHPASEHPQARSAPSSDYQARTAPFAQHDFPVLTSAPAVQPGVGAKDDLDLQYPASTNVHMLDGRATYFLPNERSSTADSGLASSLHMTTASGGAASLAQHGADRFQQSTYSWYDPGAPQNPIGQHAQPRSAPAQQPSFATGHLGSNGMQGEHRTLDQVMGNARVGDSGGGKDGQAQPAASAPRTPEMDRAADMAGRKRARDEQPDIVVDSSSSSAAAAALNHLAVGVSVRLSSGEMNDASSATTDDEAVEVQQREAQRRRTESNAQQQQLQQQALAYAQNQQLAHLYYQQQQHARFGTYGPGMQGVSAPQQMGGGGAAARTSSAQPYPSAPPPYGQQSYQGAYPGYPGYTAQWPAPSGEASSSASSSSTTSPPLGNAHPGPQRFSYYPPAAQSYYAPSYAPSTSASHAAYSPSTAITSPSVQATPGPSDRRLSAPAVHQPFGAAPPPQQQQQQGVDQKQAFGAASSAQGAQAADEPEDKPVRRRVQVDNPFVIPTAQGVKPFVNKLRFLMRNADKVGDVICWDESGKVVLVHVLNKRLEGEVLPRTFGHSNFDSLRNQFRSYGFLALKEPALSRALNPNAASSSSAAADPASTTVASTSTAPSSSPDELRDVREWKAFLHVHSAADFAAMRAEERERDALFRRIAREKEGAKRAKAAEKDKGDGAQSAQQVEVSESEDEEDSEADEDDVDEPWFSRDEIDNLRLLRRLRPKAAKYKGKAGAGGAAASGSGGSGGGGGGGGGGGAARTTTGSSSAGSSTALGSNIIQSQQQQLQCIAPRPTSTQAPSSASTSTSGAQFAPRPAIPIPSSGLAVPPFKSMPSLVPPPHVQPQAQAPAQGEARGAGSAERFDVGSLVGLRRSSGAGALG